MMNSIFENIAKFFSSVDLNLMIAGGLMILTTILIIYIITVVWFSLKRRSELSKVKLPEIDGVGEDSLTEPKFESVMPLDVELVTNEDGPLLEKNGKEKDIFATALTMETGKYISNDNLQMPNISSVIKMSNDKEDLVD